MELRYLNCRLSGMILWGGLALVAALMLLVYNDQADPGKGRKQRRPGADNHIDFPVFCPLALVIFFPGGKRGIHDADSGAEPSIKTKQGLISQSDLRYQHDHLPAPAHHLLHQPHVDFCLAAARNAMQQVGVRPSAVEILHDFSHDSGLRQAQSGTILFCILQLHGVSQALSADHPHRPSPLQALHSLGGYPQLSRHPFVGDFLLIDQFLQKPLLCHLLFAPALPQQGNDLFPAQNALNRLMLQRLHGAFRRKDGLQRLNHGGTVIFPDPCGDSDHIVINPHAVFGNSADFLHSGRIELAHLPQPYHIALHKLVAVAEGNHDACPRLQHPLKSGRHTVLKSLIQFFLRDIYDDICIKLFHLPPPAGVPPWFFLAPPYAPDLRYASDLPQAAPE